MRCNSLIIRKLANTKQLQAKFYYFKADIVKVYTG